MWPNTKVSKMLKIDYPIIQAPMAGGVTTPELVAAVSNAGGLGTLGAGYMSPEQIRATIREIRKMTERPFAVNLFSPEPIDESPEKIIQMNKYLKHYREQLGIHSVPDMRKYTESFDEQIGVILDEKVPIFSFTFGIPSSNIIHQLKNKGTMIIGTATTVREAILLQENNVDIIVAQGSEAGGHRGTFASPFQNALIGSMALVPQIVDHVHIPVIAAGGIMDARGVVASLALGASGVQMGTAFLTCPESGAHEKYKEALLNSTEESTVITRSLTGKPARGIKNAFIAEMEKFQGDVPDYPIQHVLTREIRQSAAKQNRPEWMSMWAGQASRLSTTWPASELVEQTVADVSRIIQQLGNSSIQNA
ncbi:MULTISPECIES: NAD(P)H-dependent flavin oxidoreductase [Aneurinibacillus]|uniref:Probable nitronate monooxygenase n=1 Tax=Aneurinibacillus thermoaerophilus TaxID=143495 RepID=A0A1G7YXN3_ANETH|nr:MULTISPECIES: DUF561 domain-containing protein [Aneurinibacillus]AMA73160.1 nitronate monooxygenase [Aneurinibacillus sp. XH2]MED0674420.1 DUF561 domain-containing protein [Aneurinibacillus thermoaerophilus]MED0678437.1 DUF561 domain-containing protein [Aneurinibacillus thermoaerophilus]MED0736039.1 DUF561 domain-containing protein [Aneurinibacillus thermoaerophilus]MED0758955.1 DUF561 domain-containing protein [Aneurinibacillus thermoaerophilus]